MIGTLTASSKLNRSHFLYKGICTEIISVIFLHQLENIRQTIPDWQDYMERLSGYMASTGKQYQNHAATIIRWARQDHPVSRQRNYESEEYETL